MSNYKNKNIILYKLTQQEIFPAMTAFTDQYTLPNIFFYIGQL